MSWQVQEAKQRFSEVLRAVEKEGPQTITKHGQDVAVVIDIAEYRRLTSGNRTVADVLLSIEPTMDDATAAVFDAIEAERKRDFGREIDFDL